MIRHALMLPRQSRHGYAFDCSCGWRRPVRPAVRTKNAAYDAWVEHRRAATALEETLVRFVA